jgi:hypothetical protein
MSSSASTPKSESGNSHLAENALQDNEALQPIQPAKPSLREEIERGWKWVVFVWRLLPRLGGFSAIVRTFFLVVSVLITRMLTQWGLIKHKSSSDKN